MSDLNIWVPGYAHGVDEQVVVNGSIYRCIRYHDSDHEPGVAVDWETYWEAITTGTTSSQEAAQNAALGNATASNPAVDTALLFATNYYYQDQNWAAKTVSVAADRYKLLSPNVINFDVAGTPLRLTTQVTLDLSR